MQMLEALLPGSYATARVEEAVSVAQRPGLSWVEWRQADRALEACHSLSTFTPYLDN